jgi:thermitase
VFTVWVDSAYAEVLTQELLADGENVDLTERNQTVRLREPQNTDIASIDATGIAANDPMLTQQWYAETLGYGDLYDVLRTTNPQRKSKVAIVDTGVDGAHEDLSGVFTGGKATSDQHGHGTHCAGLAGAATNNAKGVASMNWGGNFVQIRGYAALSPNGTGSNSTIARAIIAAAEDGADVISLSLGGYARRAPKVQVDAIQYARSRGAIVVVAAGNSNDDARNYAPANINGVITVAALNPDGSRAVFSNTNTSLKMPIAAPGVDMMSLVPNSQYQPMSGTSMATPIVAGLLGILRSLRPDLSTEEAYRLLRSTGRAGRDASSTGNTIQPAAAVKAAVKAG